MLGTETLLHKMKKAEKNHCRFCNNMPEMTTHVFAACQHTKEIWLLLKHWICQETGSTFGTDKKKSLLL